MMPRKHRSSSNLIKLMERQEGIGRDDVQIADNHPAFVPYGPNGAYAINRHTRRMLCKLRDTQAKRMRGLKGDQK